MEVELAVDSYYDVQALRINILNRLGSLRRRANEAEDAGEAKEYTDAADFLEEMVDTMKLQDGEKYCEKAMAALVKDHALWGGFLRDVKGIGPVMAGCLISLIDIHECPHVSSLWKYFGMDVRDGRAPKREKGKKIDWNPRGRTLCFKISMQMLFARSGDPEV